MRSAVLEQTLFAGSTGQVMGRHRLLNVLGRKLWARGLPQKAFHSKHSDFPSHVGISGKFPILCQVVKSAMWENKTWAETGSGETDGSSFQQGGQENPP